MVRYDKNKLVEITDAILDKKTVDEIEILVNISDTALTRYANSKIHQNIGRYDHNISIRAVDGKKVGSASTNILETEDMIDCLRRAEKIAEHQREDPNFKGLPSPKEERSSEDVHFKSTRDISPEERAEKVKEMIEYAGEKGVDRLYGAFKNEENILHISNSKGIKKFSKQTYSNLTCTAIADWGNDQGFGWGESCEADVLDIDHMEVAKTAVEKGLDNMDTESIEPGDFTVVLEPLAVKNLIMYLGMMGFSARAVQEQRSFMNGKFGEKIMGDNITIYDDSLDDEMIGFPFDYEGVPKQRVDIIKDGVANKVVYDSYTAGREEGKESTGHALPMPNSMSPLPLNLMVDTGDSDLHEMIDETKNGILVTRFNYCRAVHPVKSILTGLTRDGTWMIEEGEVTTPLKNLRFTQNLLDAFNSAELIGDTRKLFSLDYIPGYVSVPAMKIEDFSFTGTTEF
ncbi:MAG: TldD/PmbA family protein [Thermoplasmatota archaeon]